MTLQEFKDTYFDELAADWEDEGRPLDFDLFAYNKFEERKNDDY